MAYTPGIAVINGVKYRPYIGGVKHTFPYYKEQDEHTLLLLHGDSLEDSSMYQVPITNSGVVVSSNQSKFGGKSLYFNGDSYLTISALNLQIDLNNEWTIEFWSRASKQNTSKCAVFYMQNSKNGFVFYSNADENVRLFAGNSGWTFIPVTTVGTEIVDKWTHRAITKKDSTIYCFEDGKVTAEILASGTITMRDTFLIGFRKTSDQYGGYFGYLDEFRISDIARWTSNFTPPTTPYLS